MHHLPFLHNLSSKFFPAENAQICMRHIQSLNTNQKCMYEESDWSCFFFSLVARMRWRLRHFRKHFLPLLLLHFLLLFLLMLCAGKPGFPGNPSFPGIPWKKELRLNWLVAKRGLTTPIKSHYHNHHKVRKSSKYDWWSKITSYFVVLLITP